MENKIAFTDIVEVEVWAKFNGGEDAVVIAQAKGDFFEDRVTQGLVNAWLMDRALERANANEVERKEQERVERDLREREVVAAEQSADAAKRSARYAMWAAVIAVVAAAVAVFK